MGVDVNAMSIYGIKIVWDNDLHEAHEEKWLMADIPHILTDCMSGRYMILGPVLFDSGSHRMGFDKDQYMTIMPYQAEDKWLEWKTKFREQFPTFTHYLDESPSFITLMHYS